MDVGHPRSHGIKPAAVPRGGFPSFKLPPLLLKALTPVHQRILILGIRTPNAPELPYNPSFSNLVLKHLDCGNKMYKEMLPLMTQIPFDTFMSTFLPSGEDLTEAELRSVGDFSGLCTLFSEGKIRPKSKMYPAVAGVIQKVIDVKGADFIYRDTANTRETNVNDRCPDGSIYTTDNLAKATWELDPEAKAKAFEEYGRERGSYIGKRAYAFVEVPFSIKRAVSQSAFHNDPKSFVRHNEPTINQIAICASEILLRQHRVFLFMVYITRTYARVIRWDRAAVVVSEPMDLQQTPHLLLNFISRLVTTSTRARGHDETVTFASQDQTDLLGSCELTNPKAQKLLTDIVKAKEDFPIRAVICPRLDPKETPMTLLIGKHCSGADSPTGHATRGYIAFDTGEERLVFLKDSWRPDKSTTPPELETYKVLKEKEVQFVATALGGGDVGAPKQQETVNQDFFGMRVRPTKRVHHRIVLKEVGEPLTEYRSSLEMIIIVYDALRGHNEAYEKAGILHRDISVNNILINIDPPKDQRTGFLVDWDLCKSKDCLNNKATRAECSGTWPFLSALLLQYPWKQHELSDDLESFVHVLTWLAARFHRHQFTPMACIWPCVGPKAKIDAVDANKKNDGLAWFKYHFFDAGHEEPGGYYGGGDQKLYCIKDGCLNKLRFVDTWGPLPQLLASLYKVLKEHYDATDLEALEGYAHEVGQLQIPESQKLGFEASEEPVATRARALEPLEPTDSLLPVPEDLFTELTAISPSRTTKPLESSNRGNSIRILDHHHAFMNIFSRIANTTEDVNADKTADQFEGLTNYVYAGTAQGFGTHRSSKGSSNLPSDSASSRNTSPDVSEEHGVSYNPRSTSSDASSASPGMVGSTNIRVTRSSSRHDNFEHQFEQILEEIPIEGGLRLEDAVEASAAGSSKAGIPSISSDASSVNSFGGDKDPLPLPPVRIKRKHEATPSFSAASGNKRRNTRRRG
ncbi:hypothetical protein NM688_g266 [Phlebia brevispora]|uniref:Uncharacterized protein n=1 Tax=Phlebia brevispora TaxID=194682 RepID=A0ACC1TF82_9APHY|nr:hypothetical protein NM688_g266 [Phlebia brevispora]